MFSVGFIYYIIFKYVPMYGVIIAFKHFDIYEGFQGSPWADYYGFEHFVKLFTNPEFYKLLKNTLMLSLYGLIFTFPAPIILALSLNEVKNQKWKKLVQTVSYLPHFISIVVICGMLHNFLSLDGMINQIIKNLGGTPQLFLNKKEYFRTIYILSDIWQGVGWSTIIYLAALSSIDVQLYEAAVIDGANRWKRMIHITLPGIAPTIIILFIMKVGSIIEVGAQKVLLLYNPMIYDTADVISTYVYRRGILNADYSYTTAVSLFESLVGFIMVVITNKISKKLTETSLW